MADMGNEETTVPGAMSGVGMMVPADLLEPAALVERVRRIESLGYRSVWIPDMFGREIYVTAGHLLANTTTITVGSGIAHIYGRDAINSAQAGRTLAELSGGRFVQGLGVSHPIAAEARGLSWESPVATMRAHLEGMRSGGPLQLRAGLPPVFIAAHGPKLMELAAELADGASTYMQPPEHTAASRAVLGTDKGLSVVLPCCLHTDPALARAAGREILSIYLPLPAYQRQWAANGFDESDWSDGGSDRLIDTYVAWGDEDAIRARVQEHLDAGATGVQLSPRAPAGSSIDEILHALAPGPRKGRRWSEFNREVIEEFRANDGRVARFDGLDVVVVHTRRGDGTVREVPLIPVLEGDEMYLFGTNAGSREDPAWVDDLDARPEVDLEHAFGGSVVIGSARAHRLPHDEARSLVAVRAASTPQLQSYLDTAGGREIPVFRVEPPVHRTLADPV